MRFALALALPLLLAACACQCPPDRSRTAVYAFRAQHPCPATGQVRGACPGWQVDHVQPLCAGGVDAPANLQWLTVEEHRIKTRTDVRACRLRQPSPVSD